MEYTPEQLEQEAEYRRQSLANEIRGVLKTRGHWAPERPSDLISGVGQVCEKYAALLEEVAGYKELTASQHNANRLLSEELAREKDAVLAALEENAKLKSAIRWALGYDEGEPHFGEENSGTGAFAWRTELRRRADFPRKEEA